MQKNDFTGEGELARPSSAIAAESPANPEQIPSTAQALPTAEEYVEGLAAAFVENTTDPSMDKLNTIRAIYTELVRTVRFAEPPAPDLWRYRCNPEIAPPYLHNRALGPLSCRIGSCEDFAAALTLALRAAGFRAEYVSGLTVSAKREWVDHAWTVIELETGWYHLDSQLEQNVLRDGQLDYRYFLRDDQWMLADHLWGAYLAAYWQGRQSPEQRRVLQETMTPPVCAGPPVPRPKPALVTLELPDMTMTVKGLEEERRAYERVNGSLPPVEIAWEPPLFAVMPKER